VKCAIHQPQFLPWLGYFDKMGKADVFVLLDNVQFKKNEFQNRNKIRVGNEARWITVPVNYSFGTPINRVPVVYDRPWCRKMLATMEQSYGRSPGYDRYAGELAEILGRTWGNIAELNRATVAWLASCLGVATETLAASELPEFSTNPTQRLVDICRHFGAETYLSGAGGHDYLETQRFDEAGITLEFQEFLHPDYPQWYNSERCGFMSHLSAVDAVFNDATDLLTAQGTALDENTGDRRPSR